MTKRLPQVISIVIVLVSCLVLLGWMFDVALLKSGLPGSPSTMKPNTALGFLTSGIALNLLGMNQTVKQVSFQKRIKFLIFGFAFSTLLIGALTLSQYFWGWNLGIDEWLIQDRSPSTTTLYPGRMGENTAFNFVLTGIALLLLQRKTRRDDWLAQSLGCLVAAIALMSLVGHMFGVNPFYLLVARVTTLAPHTAVLFILLSLGILFTHPNQGLMRTITSPSAGGLMAQQLLPWAIAFPLGLNGIFVWGAKIGWFDTSFSEALQVAILICTLSIVIWWNAHKLNQIDYQRQQAEISLQQININLEQRVAERTQQLSEVNEQLETRVEQRTAELTQMNARLQLSLIEKEVLLKEIHHRVKNNLQIIYSLLRLQHRQVKDQLAAEILLESRNRVKAIALLHEKLYRSKDLAEIDLAHYIPSLAAYLFSSYKLNTNAIRLHTHIDEMTLNMDTAVPCGLILNELVSNALKYAFPDNRDGMIQIELRTHSDATTTLMVRDDGVGIPADLDWLTIDTLGLKLVHDLTTQLNGQLEVDRAQGTRFTITFPTHTTPISYPESAMPR